MPREITLTSIVGKFLFYSDVKLSHAKMVRDSVMGQMLNHNSGRRIKTAQDAYQYITECDGDWCKTPFSFIPEPVKV